MNALKVVTEDQEFTGNVTILGEINNASVKNIVTEIQKSKVSTQKIRTDLDNYLESIVADGILDTQEKKSLRQKWLEIQSEYYLIYQRATAAGVATDSTELTDYGNAYTALNTYFNGSSGVLTDMTTASTVDKSVMNQKLTDYYNARENTNSAILTATSENASHVFYDTPTVPYKKGDLWISDGVLYQSTVDRTDVFTDADWKWCVRSNISCYIQSTNGDVFRPGQSTTTTLTPRAFKNGLEITDTLPDSAFRWTRTSFIPQTAPNDDATWNSNHSSGYRTVEVSTDTINARATYTLEILE